MRNRLVVRRSATRPATYFSGQLRSYLPAETYIYHIVYIGIE